MAYYFDLEVVLNNAFYGIQDRTGFLSIDELVEFCQLVTDELQKNVDTVYRNNPVFDISKSDDRFYEDHQSEFMRAGKKIILTGSDITLDKLDFINSRYDDSGVEKSLENARNRFSQLLNKDGEFDKLEEKIDNFIVI